MRGICYYELKENIFEKSKQRSKRKGVRAWWNQRVLDRVWAILYVRRAENTKRTKLWTMTCKWESWNIRKRSIEVWHGQTTGIKWEHGWRNGNPGTSDKIGFTDLLRRKFGMHIIFEQIGELTILRIGSDESDLFRVS